MKILPFRRPSTPEPRWAILLCPTQQDAELWAMLTLTEDCIQPARDRGWILLASETDILQERI